MKYYKIVIVVVAVVVLGYLGYKYLYAPKYAATSTGSNTVIMQNLAFSPSTITVAKGTKVAFKNNDSTAHTVTFSTFGSKKLSKGGVYKYTFNRTGSFEYRCTIHPSMTGKVIVK